MKKLIVLLTNEYLKVKNKLHFKRLQNFQNKFESDMKRLGISLVAQKDPNNEQNVWLEFVKTEELNQAKAVFDQQTAKDFLDDKGDNFTITTVSEE